MQQQAIHNAKHEILNAWLNGVSKQLSQKKLQVRVASDTKRARARARREAQMLFQEYYRSIAQAG